MDGLVDAPRVAIRVDASSRIGTGHLMRCIAFADELTLRGVRTRFLCRHLTDYLRDMVLARGHEVEIFEERPPMSVPVCDLEHSAWLGVSQELDANDTIKALSGQGWDWLVVDHYALDRRWESILRPLVKKIMVIDDIADRVHDCDLLLDQNYYQNMEQRYESKVPGHCHLLLGPRYALLRPEFRRLHMQAKPRSGEVKRILIFFGGMDADNLTGRTLQAIDKLGLSDIHVDVVIGAGHPSRRSIEDMCGERGFYCHVQTDRMGELMAGADLAIGAGGVSIWERCCVGLPSLAISVANNQQQQLHDIALQGLVLSPVFDGPFESSIARHIECLMENAYLLQMMSRNGIQFVDGKGVWRVMMELGMGGVHVRPAHRNDSDCLFEWRNHPTVRAFSRNSRLISLEDHEAWLESVLNDPDRMLLIGESEGDPVGVVRFDTLGDRAEVSLYLTPDNHPPGRGAELLRAAEFWLAQTHPHIKVINAQVLGGNIRSNRLFCNAGYVIESTAYSKRLH